MSELKVIREIDTRNELYGQYKYQVVLSRMNVVRWEVVNWCSKHFGDEHQWSPYNGRVVQERNPRWRTKRKGYKTPHLYLKGDVEATLFSLHWAGRDSS